ncbi:UDP-N-acetylmuramate dehydrogenase [Vagococcus entomophilus]|nr:UDP-N-acetylmuramate dehydrogenase [Vagococcus entomophilus]
MNQMKIEEVLAPIQMLFEEPLANYTYTKTGGPAEVLAFPKDKDEVKQIVDFARENNISWLVLGNASNLIVRDGGIRGIVIMLNRLDQVMVLENQVTALAGAKLIDTSYEALNHTLSGLEFACGIPGSIGGAVFMNAGAYGGEIAHVLESAEVLLPDGTIRTFTNQELDFSYRHSVVQENHGVVLSATFVLEKGEAQKMKAQMDELTDLRESKQPLEYPSCGSVFKRPEGHFTGKLIQDAGLQGLIWGGAQISEKHAGFIVNINHATATDYIELIAHIQKEILAQFGVVLETEVRIIGNEVFNSEK